MLSCPVRAGRYRLANDGGGAPETALRPGVSRSSVCFSYARPSAPGKQQRRRRQRDARPQWPATIGCTFIRRVECGGAGRQPRLSAPQRRSAGSPRCSCAPSEREETVWDMTEAAHPKRRCIQEFRAPRIVSRTRGPVRRRNNRGGTANAPQGQTGSPRSVQVPPASSAPAEQLLREPCDDGASRRFLARPGAFPC